ncbi:MAG TPA: hypothetical protein VG897_03095, partial [Terriglobales bacterium]|nr:hypothetical protein [Terriglobales bacterium]
RFVRADLPTSTGPFIDIERLRQARVAVETSFRDIVETEGWLSEYNSLLGEWKEQIKNTSIARDMYSTNPSRMSTARALVATLTTIMHEAVSLDDIRRQLAASALRSLETLYSSAAWLGLFGQLKVLRERVRGIPALRFDPDYPAASAYCTRIINAMRASDDSPRAIDTIVDLKAMDASLSKEDNSNYHTLVIHGLAFATKGHWYAARTLCQVAIKVTDFMSEEQQQGRKGREAAYLLAVATRRLAASRIDLDEAAAMLEDAYRRETAGASEDCRFVSEDIAIRAARLNFDVFLPLEAPQYPIGHAAGQRISIASTKIFELSIAARDLAEKDDEERIRRWVLQQLVVNVLGTALICYRFGIPIESGVWSVVVQFLRVGQDISEGPVDRRHNWDDVCRLVYLTAYAVFGSDQSVRNAASADLDKLSFVPYAPFDRERDRHFREMVRLSVQQKPR